jgi:hypothetical protein
MTMTERRYPDSVYFVPWEGNNYEHGVAGCRVLLVAESCYTWEEEDGRAQVPDTLHAPTMIQWRLDGNQMRFLSNIESTFLAAAPILSSPSDFWNSIALYEFVQRPMASPSHRPTPEDWRQSWAPFEAVARQLSPDCVFILGYEMWKNLQPEQEKEVLVFAAEEELWRCGYAFQSTHTTPTFRIHHPSRAYQPDAWAPCVRKALELATGRKRGARLAI